MALGTVVAATCLATRACAGSDRKQIYDLVDGMQVDIKVYSSLDILLKFPTRIIRAVPTNGDDYNVDLDDKELTLTTLPGAGITSLHIKLAGGEHVAVLLKPAKSPDAVIISHIFRYKLDVVPICTREGTQPAEKHVLSAMNKRFEFAEPMVGEFIRDGFHLVLETSRQVYEGSILRFRIRVHNLGGKAYPIAAIQVLNADSVEYEAAFADMSEQLPASLGPERDTDGSIVIRQPDTLGKDFLLRLLPGVEGIPPAVFHVAPMQAAWSERPTPRAYGPLEKRLVVTMTAVSGAANLDDGPDIGIGVGRKAWAMVNAVGLYGSYGAFKHVRFGGGGGFVGTRRITMDTPQGAYRVMYHGARLYAGTTIHTGSTVVPYAHARLGILAVVQDFERDDIVESEYRLAGLLMLGGGVDWFVSRHFLLGLAISANGPIFGQETGLALEAGLRIGWAFERAP